MRISKKIIYGIASLVMLGIFQLVLTNILQNDILKSARQIKNVETPLGSITQRVICYDSELTEHVQSALLSAQKGDFENVEKHRLEYIEKGTHLDTVLEKDARILLSQSAATFTSKGRTSDYLANLEKSSQQLVGVEEKAFEAMMAGDVETAHALVVSDEYAADKARLQQEFFGLASVEKQANEAIVNRIIAVSQQIVYVNLIVMIMFISIVLSLLLIIRAFLTTSAKTNRSN